MMHLKVRDYFAVAMLTPLDEIGCMICSTVDAPARIG
jgi:hypothetical protein